MTGAPPTNEQLQAAAAWLMRHGHELVAMLTPPDATVAQPTSDGQSEPSPIEPGEPEPAATPKPAANGDIEQLSPVQRAVWDVLSHCNLPYGATIRQLSTRCKARGPVVFEAVKELKRLGYARYEGDNDGQVRARLNYRREPIETPGKDNPIETHVRIVGPMIHGGPATEGQLAARCWELTKEQRRNVLKELVENDCLEPCFNHRGIPAFRVTSLPRAEKGLDAIKLAKASQPASQTP